MTIIPIILLVSVSFINNFSQFASSRSLVVDHLLLYLWILVPLVHQNKGDFGPTIMIPPLNVKRTDSMVHILYL